MIMLLTLTAILFLTLYFMEHYRYKRLNQELLYIDDRLKQIRRAEELHFSENGYILVPSENTSIKSISADLNRIFETFYFQKTEYNRSRQVMTQVLTNISHDLRTPLTVLKGYSEILIGQAAASHYAERFADVISKIDEKADELIDTVNQYFTLSKIESGDMAMEIQKADVTQICHEVILDYYDILEKEQFDVEILLEDEPAFASVDKDALKRILKNLIDNAIKHGGSGKYLAMSLQKEPDGVVIEITDHGQGIEKKHQEQIFTRNYVTGKTSGSGLGLTISHSLSLQMGARIQVTSVPGLKTVFSLHLKS